MLTRGPVHEAFAETVTFDPEPGIVVPKAPPDRSKKWRLTKGRKAPTWPGSPATGVGMTSETISCGSAASGAPCRPVASGCPGIGPNRDKAINGRRDTGPMRKRTRFSTCPSRPRRSRRVRTLPRLPRTITWLPGCWVWQQNRYAWRPGNWIAGHQDWQWVPDYYVWTPRGYVFVDGYWDYSVARRGVLFAPVYFNADVYAQRGFSYSPSTVINPAVFVSHLFLRPSYGHYYFGDYYASNYSNAGLLSVVCVPVQPFGLRSVLCSRALAASAGPGLGEPHRGELPQFPRQ